MKMSREICKSCINNRRISGLPWSSADTFRWDKGEVLCPLRQHRIYTDAVPKWCDSQFEHAVAAGMSDENE